MFVVLWLEVWHGRGASCGKNDQELQTQGRKACVICAALAKFNFHSKTSVKTAAFFQETLFLEISGSLPRQTCFSAGAWRSWAWSSWVNSPSFAHSTSWQSSAKKITLRLTRSWISELELVFCLITILMGLLVFSDNLFRRFFAVDAAIIAGFWANVRSENRPFFRASTVSMNFWLVVFKHFCLFIFSLGNGKIPIPSGYLT